MSNHPVFGRMLRKLQGRVALDESDLEALKSLSFRQDFYERGGYIVREGWASVESALILEGFAVRQKLTHEGQRQIISFHVPGDFVDIEGSLLKMSDHNVQALTRCKIAHVPSREIISLIDNHPRVGRALWIETLIEGSIYREWVMNVGQRPGRQRIAHLLCEFAERLKLAGMGDEGGYDLPMTQEQLGDATGLTSVHVNRSLKSLEAEGLIIREGRFLKIPDWQRLQDSSGFSARYLHLEEAV